MTTMQTHGIGDLRASLTTHADAMIQDLPETTHVARGAAVRTRVRRARNQRRAGLAGGVAAALVIAGGVIATATLPHRHASAPQLANHSLQRALRINGFDYVLGTTAQSSRGADQLVITLPAAQRDRYVQLVGSGLGSGDATLVQGRGAARPRHGVTTYDTGSVLNRVAADSALDAPVPLSAERTTLTVRLRHAGPDAVVGLAVYDQSTTMPTGGVSTATMAFPARVGISRLITGVIGKVGQDSISITFQGPVRHPDLESLCTTTAKQITGHVTSTGLKGWSGGDCGPLDPVYDVDLGTFHGEAVPSGGYGPGTHTVTLTAMRHTPHVRKDTPVDLPGTRLALGLYDDTSPVRTVDGSDWDTRMLADGRLWQLADVVPYREGIAVDATRGPVMLGFSFAGASDYCLTAAGDHGDVFDYGCDASQVGGPSGRWGEKLMPGSTYTLTTRSSDHPRRPGSGITSLLIYRPAP